MQQQLFPKTKLKLARNSFECGFSLPDLVIGGGLAVLVATGGGVAVASMLDSSNTSNTRSERRIEVNRTLEFIKMEVNRAENLLPSPTFPANFSSKLAELSSEIDPTSVTAVLQLTTPGSVEPTTYFTATPINGIWKGPKVLYRIGPNFAADGQYSDLSDSTSWVALPLLDRLESFSAPVSGRSVVLQPTGKIQKLLGRHEYYTTQLNAGIKQQRVELVPFEWFPGSEGSTATIPDTTETSIPGTTETSTAKCNNGLGNGSEGCTPGNARPNDEVVRNTVGEAVCIPSPGHPCTSYNR
jgi:hypothetical protein